IPNPGRAGAMVDQARAQLAASLADLRRSELDVEFRAAQAYIEVLRAREAKTIAQANLDQATRQADDTKKRIDAGDVPAADLLKAQVPVAQDRAALVRSQLAETVAEQILNDILQRDLDKPLDLAPLPDSPAGPEMDASAAEAMANENSP